MVSEVRTSRTTGTARLSCSLLPGSDPATFRDALLVRIDDARVDIEAQELVPPSTSAQDFSFDAPDIARFFTLSPEVSSAGVFRRAGVAAIGLSPLFVDAAELKRRARADESVRLDELARAAARWPAVIESLSAR